MLSLTMNHRPSTILPSISLLAVLMLASLSRAQTLTLDKCLDDLAEKGSLGPVVAVMHAPVAVPADLSSLEGLAKTFGLKLFEQDGIHVLGPAECLHLYDLSPYFPKERPKPGVSPKDEFFSSLTPEQLKVIGSRGGLHFAGLSEEQQSLVKRMFTGRITLAKRNGDPPSADDLSLPPPTFGDELPPPPSLPEPLQDSETISLGSVPVEALTITGSLSHGDVLLQDRNDNYVCSLPGPDVPMWDPAEHDLHVDPASDLPLPKIPEPFGPNVLKPSNLDYERPELQKQANFAVRTDLREVIALAAKESGLPLLIGPGSEQIPMYVKAGGQSIGQVLKAASLATGGTWRKVGDLFVYTLDLTGLGSLMRQASDLLDLSSEGELHAEQSFDALRVRNVLLNLPPIPGTTFTLTPQQVTDITAGLAENPTQDACSIPWRALTPQQQASALKECPDLKDRQVDDLYIDVRVFAELSLHFPAVGNANIGFMPAKHQLFMDLLPPDDWQPHYSPEFEPRVWPKGSKIPMPSGTRGLLYRLAKSDTPATVATTTARYGFNTLLLRIFADGYTIFPSAEFPQLPGLKADDLLRNVIAIAHSRGIKVVGVIDVLRWSNGDNKHWLYKQPEIIGRDITGRMNTEWMAQRIVDPEEAMQERMVYGDTFDGDFVSPFQSSVRQKLSALVGELTTYDLDGLAFDHTSIVYPAPWDYETNYPSGGQTGFNDLARSAFVRGLGVDPIDIAYPGTAADILPTPLSPISEGAAIQKKAWAAFYRTACDSMLDILLEDCGKTKPGIPVWLVDSYRDDFMIENAVESHDWSKFEGRIDTVVGWGSAAKPDYAGKGTKTIQLVRVSDPVDLLYIASYVANRQKKTFPGMLGEEDLSAPPQTPINDIILEFPCSEKRRTEFLKLLETARPVKTR